MKLLLVALGLLWATPTLAGPSVYETAPDDPAAIFVRGVGDGRADDTAAIQSAIDAAAHDGAGGIVFLPSGRYRISRTILLRPAVRLFGVGRTRPVILLGPDTPGFTSGIATMLAFIGNDQYNVARFNDGRAAVPPPSLVPFDPKIFDASSNSFYSALANIDFEIGKGNRGAAAVRARGAQHAFLRHVDFRLGDGLAGIYQAGNFGQDLHFHGGRYGILSEKTSPAWQYTLADSSFEGQSEAAIREHELGLTLVNVSIRDVPVGIEIDHGYGDWLWGKDVRFERVAKAAILIDKSRDVYTQIGFDNALAASVPVFARFRDSGRSVAGQGRAYRVKAFSHGLGLPALGAMGEFATDAEIEPLRALPAQRPPAIRPLPPVSQWTNVRSLGVKGDDSTDDTAALQRAIDGHPILYLPAGRYRITDTLRLRPDTRLVALHPSLTHIYLPEDVPAFAGVGGAKALVESAGGGDAIVSGLGLWAGFSNPRATALLWKAGEASLVEDVKIEGGAGTRLPPGNARPAAPPRFDSQHPSIWVKDGGGGSFVAIWSPNTLAQAGFYVSDTRTPGHVYQLSAEHHERVEIVLDHVENWEFLAPQTEQEVRDGIRALSTEIRHSRNILFANYHGYRVTRSTEPAAAAIRLYDSSDIRFRNLHVNGESAFASCDPKGCGTFVRATKFPFENSIVDVTRKLAVREREFAALDVDPTRHAEPVSASSPPPHEQMTNSTLKQRAAQAVRGTAEQRSEGGAEASHASVQRLETGFHSIAGAAVDAKGKLYFIDRAFHRIYAWSKGEGLNLVADAPLDPVNLAVDRSGNLLVLSSAGRDGTVYSLTPGKLDSATAIAPSPAAPNPGATILLPVNIWENGEFRDRIDPATYAYPTLADLFAAKVGTPKAQDYVSPDGSLVLPAFRVWNQGPLDQQGWRWSDALDSHGLVGARVGEGLLVTNGSENLTYSGLVGAGGTLTDLKIVAERGGESAALGPDGKVYVANGQVFVYAADGKLERRIDVPERPLQLIFGGEGGRTLFILAHRSLYAVEM